MIEDEKLMIGDLAAALQLFAKEREWDRFHTPKNLATAISVESAELLEHFQWSRGSIGWHELSDENFKNKVQEELADILLYVIRFADLANINLQSCAEDKIRRNGEKYPVERFKGTDKKYNE